MLEWSRLVNTDRFRVNDDDVCARISVEPAQARTAFAQDADRIMFSSSFRRLSRKTQVHPLAMNDHLHNRLTHSLEVASVGRSLGTIVGGYLEEKRMLTDSIRAHHIGEIVQAACLAHDIGNPPFGHAGEAAMQDWFQTPLHERYVRDLTETQKSDFNNFDGNAQSFRIVTALENNAFRGGMRLTYPTLAAMVKYPVSSRHAEKEGKTKFGFYKSEENIFLHIARELGLGADIDRICRHPLSFLTEAADDICYNLVDLEDAHEMKILTIDDVFDIVAPAFEGKTKGDILDKPEQSARRQVSYLRTCVMNIMIKDIVAAFISHHDTIMAGAMTDDIVSVACDRTRHTIGNARRVAREKIFKEKRKTTLEIGAYTVFERLFDVFIPAVYEHVRNDSNKGKSFKTSRVLDLLGTNAPAVNTSLYGAYQAVVDFVSGMTDDYATFVSSQFSGAGK